MLGPTPSSSRCARHTWDSLSGDLSTRPPLRDDPAEAPEIRARPYLLPLRVSYGAVESPASSPQPWEPGSAPPGRTVADAAHPRSRLSSYQTRRPAKRYTPGCPRAGSDRYGSGVIPGAHHDLSSARPARPVSPRTRRRRCPMRAPDRSRQSTTADPALTGTSQAGLQSQTRHSLTSLRDRAMLGTSTSPRVEHGARRCRDCVWPNRPTDTVVQAKPMACPNGARL